MDPLAPSPGESIVELAAAAPGEPALRYRVWAEPAAPARATLALLSGVMSNTAWLRPLAAAWRDMGYRVIGLERRGSGLNYEPGAACEDAPSAEALVSDARRQLAHGRAPERPVVLVGWCWGAILAVHVALAEPVAGLGLLTPGIHPSAALEARMRALAEQAQGLPPEVPALPSPITDEMFTEGPALDGFIRRDAARWQRFSPRFLDVSTRLTLGARMRLRRIAVPVLVALAEDDATTDNDKILAELTRLPAGAVRTTTLPGPHGLQFEHPVALAQRLDAWAHDALGV